MNDNNNKTCVYEEFISNLNSIKAYDFNSNPEKFDGIACALHTNPMRMNCLRANEIGWNCDGCSAYQKYFFNNEMSDPIFIDPKKEYYIVNDGKSLYPVEKKVFLSKYRKLNDNSDFFKSKQSRHYLQRGTTKSLHFEARQFIESKHKKKFNCICNQGSLYENNYCPFLHKCSTCPNYKAYIEIDNNKILLEDKVYIIKLIESDELIVVSEDIYKKLFIKL